MLSINGVVGEVRIRECLGIFAVRETLDQLLFVKIGIRHAFHSSQHQEQVVVCFIQLGEVGKIMD